MNNQERKARPAMVNFNRNKPLFYPYSVLVNKCSGSCNDINEPYTILCVSNVAKNIDIKVFSLLPKANETRYVSYHENCPFKCRLDTSVCNDKQR